VNPETRTLHLTANGRPAVLPVVGFYHLPESPMIGGMLTPATTRVVMPNRGTMVVDESPEEIAALWDAATPTAEVVVDRWQTCPTSPSSHPYGWGKTDAPGGFEPCGPWEPMAAAVQPTLNDRTGDVLSLDSVVIWKRPLRRVVS